MKKEETPYIMPKYPNFSAVWTKFETFYFQIFCSKRGNQLIRGKRSSLQEQEVSTSTPVMVSLDWIKAGWIINFNIT